MLDKGFLEAGKKWQEFDSLKFWASVVYSHLFQLEVTYKKKTVLKEFGQKVHNWHDNLQSHGYVKTNYGYDINWERD